MARNTYCKCPKCGLSIKMEVKPGGRKWSELYHFEGRCKCGAIVDDRYDKLRTWQQEESE